MSLQLENLPARPQAPLPTAPYDRWVLPSGEETALFARAGTDYLVRFPDVADFSISLDRQAVRCWPAPGMSARDLAYTYFNQIVPLVMACNGELVLHASAVVIDGRAIAFVGPSGRGKSTLAAAFANIGCPFLTDDGLILDRKGDGYWVRPRSPVLRLCPDSEAAILQRAEPSLAGEADKKQVVAGDAFLHCDQPARLAAIYLLSEPSGADRARIEPLPSPIALAELLKHSFILDVEHRARVKHLFDALADLAAAVDCFALDFPRRYPALPDVLAAIMAHGKRVGSND